MSKKPNLQMLAVIRNLALKNIQIHADQPSIQLASACLDPSDVEQIDAHLNEAIGAVRNSCLSRFMQSVFAEPEVRQLLTQPVLHKGVIQGLSVDPLQSIAEGVLQWCNFGSAEREVVYVATFLHGIAHWLKPCLHPGSNSGDVLFTIARRTLYQLDDKQPAHSRLLRLCMGWGNADEESEFAEELQRRIRRAVQALDLMKFKSRGQQKKP